jgi:hypothetical protein
MCKQPYLGSSEGAEISGLKGFAAFIYSILKALCKVNKAIELH